MNKEDAVKEALDDLCNEAHYNGNTLTLINSWRATIESAIAANKAEVDLSKLPLHYKEGLENGGYYLATDVIRLLATPPATTGASTETDQATEPSKTSSRASRTYAYVNEQVRKNMRATECKGHSVGASTVLTDERIGQLSSIAASQGAQAGSKKFYEIFTRLIEREVLGQNRAPSKQPTEAMLNAARDWSVQKYGVGIGNDAAIGCWQAMNAADERQPREVAAQAGQVAVPESSRAAAYDAVAQALEGIYYCGRVWEAWNVGTMREDDFTPAGEVDDVVNELIDAVIGAISAPSPAKESK